mgnify:CR=1 FL=1
MLYLDIMNEEGGQMYLDIQSVEAIGQGLRAGIILQGVLGDGCREAQVLVEQIDGQVSLVFLEHQVPFVAVNDVDSDFRGLLKKELQKELCQVGAARLNFTPTHGVEIAF